MYIAYIQAQNLFALILMLVSQYFHSHSFFNCAFRLDRAWRPADIKRLPLYNCQSSVYLFSKFSATWSFFFVTWTELCKVGWATGEFWWVCALYMPRVYLLYFHNTIVLSLGKLVIYQVPSMFMTIPYLNKEEIDYFLPSQKTEDILKGCIYSHEYSAELRRLL